MKKFAIGFGLVLVFLIAVALISFFMLKSQGQKKLSETHHANVTHLKLSSDSTVLARGEHLTNVLCRECHSPNLAGMAMIEDDGFGKLYAPNLTAGKGGLTGWYTMEDWDRSIRHGIRHDSSTLMIMPSISFQYLSDDDLTAIVSYITQVEPVDDVVPDREFQPFALFLIGVGAFDDALQASLVNHDFTSVPQIDETDKMVYGDYLHKIGGCNHCHGTDMAGGKVDPNGPVAPNITNGGNMGNWTQDEFIATIRTGTTPEGNKLDPIFMPYNAFKHFTDDELQAIYTYIKAQPGLEDAKI